MLSIPETAYQRSYAFCLDILSLFLQGIVTFKKLLQSRLILTHGPFAIVGLEVGSEEKDEVQFILSWISVLFIFLFSTFDIIDVTIISLEFIL